MDSHCNHTNCTITSSNKSVCQTLSELDWERGIWNAAFTGDKDKVQALIDKSHNPKETVNQTDASGYTALHYAARSGHLDICKLLLQYGANIDAVTRTGQATPLHKAAAAGRENTLKFLIKSGANINLQDADGETILHKAVYNKQTNIVNLLLGEYPEIKVVKDNKGCLAFQ